MPGRSGVLPALTEKSRVLDGLLQRDKCWLERNHGLRNLSGSQAPKPDPQSLSAGQIESEDLGSPGGTNC